MKDWNRESRELKLRHRESVSAVNVQYNRRQVQLSHDIEQARNERSLYIAKIKMQEDVEANAARLADATERIRSLSLRKVDLDHERKLALLAIDREHAAEVAALEAKYRANREDDGKEVADV